MPDFLPYAYFQGQIVPFAEAKISIATHALHYGTAAFGGLRGIPDPQNPDQVLVFRLDRHCRRLSQSARLLCFDLPAERIEQVIVELIREKSSLHVFLHPPLGVHLRFRHLAAAAQH
jgi:branched-chain amino acid aminotransferase